MLVGALVEAAAQLLMLAAVKLGSLLAGAAFGVAWAITGVMGFLFASIFARGFAIMAVGQLAWLAASAVAQVFRLEPGTPDASY